MEPRQDHEDHPPPTTVKDPVCGMDVDPAAPKGGSVTREGKTYHFCSPRCREKLLAEPAKYLTPEILPTLEKLAEALEALPEIDPASVEAAVRSTAEHAGVKAAALIHATRVAVTGRTVSAGLFELISVLGRPRVRRRLHRAVNYTPQT